MDNKKTLISDFHKANRFQEDPYVYMSHIQSLLDRCAKFDYYQRYGNDCDEDLIDCINALSYNQEWSSQLHEARKIRNRFVHEGKISYNELKAFNSTINEYIEYITSSEYTESINNARTTARKTAAESMSGNFEPNVIRSNKNPLSTREAKLEQELIARNEEKKAKLAKLEQELIARDKERAEKLDKIIEGSALIGAKLVENFNIGYDAYKKASKPWWKFWD